MTYRMYSSPDCFKRLDTLGRFSAILYKADNFWDFSVCFPVHPSSLSFQAGLEKGSTLKEIINICFKNIILPMSFLKRDLL